MALPQNDFTWNWGDETLARGGHRQLSMIGSESGFRCELDARMRITSRLSRQDIRNLENQIRNNVFFVQAVANSMYYLELQRDLGYATLNCVRPQVDRDADEEARANRETRARERAARERERRRARRARQDDDN
tara:strand:+ start:316 stop:717 length:402 start_codon:yes stop_codon:yes gene_type:complete